MLKKGSRRSMSRPRETSSWKSSIPSSLECSIRFRTNESYFLGLNIAQEESYLISCKKDRNSQKTRFKISLMLFRLDSMPHR